MTALQTWTIRLSLCNSCFSRDVTDYANVEMRHVGVSRSVILHVNRGNIGHL